MTIQEMVETVRHLLNRIEDHSYKIYDLETRMKEVEARLGGGKGSHEKSKGRQESGSRQKPSQGEEAALRKLLEKNEAEEEREWMRAEERKNEEEMEAHKTKLRTSLEEFFNSQEKEEEEKTRRQKEHILKMQESQEEMREMQAEVKKRRENFIAPYHQQEKKIEGYCASREESTAGSAAGEAEYYQDEHDADYQQSEGRTLHADVLKSK